MKSFTILLAALVNAAAVIALGKSNTEHMIAARQVNTKMLRRGVPNRRLTARQGGSSPVFVPSWTLSDYIDCPVTQFSSLTDMFVIKYASENVNQQNRVNCNYVNEGTFTCAYDGDTGGLLVPDSGAVDALCPTQAEKAPTDGVACHTACPRRNGQDYFSAGQMNQNSGSTIVSCEYSLVEFQPTAYICQYDGASGSFIQGSSGAPCAATIPRVATCLSRYNGVP